MGFNIFCVFVNIQCIEFHFLTQTFLFSFCCCHVHHPIHGCAVNCLVFLWHGQIQFCPVEWGAKMVPLVSYWEYPEGNVTLPKTGIPQVLAWWKESCNTHLTRQRVDIILSSWYWDQNSGSCWRDSLTGFGWLDPFYGAPEAPEPTGTRSANCPSSSKMHGDTMVPAWAPWHCPTHHLCMADRRRGGETDNLWFGVTHPASSPPGRGAGAAQMPKPAQF